MCAEYVAACCMRVVYVLHLRCIRCSALHCVAGFCSVAHAHVHACDLCMLKHPPPHVCIYIYTYKYVYIHTFIYVRTCSCSVHAHTSSTACHLYVLTHPPPHHQQQPTRPETYCVDPKERLPPFALDALVAAV